MRRTKNRYSKKRTEQRQGSRNGWSNKFQKRNATLSGPCTAYHRIICVEATKIIEVRETQEFLPLFLLPRELDIVQKGVHFYERVRRKQYFTCSLVHVRTYIHTSVRPFNDLKVAKIRRHDMLSGTYCALTFIPRAHVSEYLSVDRVTRAWWFRRSLMYALAHDRARTSRPWAIAPPLETAVSMLT